MVWSRGSTSFFCRQIYPTVPASFVNETTLTPLNGFGTLVKNQLATDIIETISCLGFDDLTLTLNSLYLLCRLTSSAQPLRLALSRAYFPYHSMLALQAMSSFNHHRFTPDSSVWTSRSAWNCKPAHPAANLHVSTWMPYRHLETHTSKAKLWIFPPHTWFSSYIPSFVNGVIRCPVIQAKNLGVHSLT